LKYLITGHTGFKGSWLVALLTSLGHDVVGLALPPLRDSLYMKAKMNRHIFDEMFLDIRNRNELEKYIKEQNPDYVIHLAAQPLVRESYKDPLGTFEINFQGTLNVLSAVSKTPSIKSTLIITTDKVYRNVNKKIGYLEDEPLGGFDPYSASKAAADLATQSWTNSFAQSPIGIARAGNVIGGGDWAKDRLIPDIVNSLASDSELSLRFPNSVRPWQHVLDCLNGYLMALDYMEKNHKSDIYNFGPNSESGKTVLEVVEASSLIWGKEPKIRIESEVDLHEANLLLLNSDKARKVLGWRDKFDFNNAIIKTIDFYKRASDGENVEDILFEQVNDFLNS
jgi:CDP-glucose 4,6-dehydratase